MLHRAEAAVAALLVVAGLIVAWAGASVPPSFLDTRFGSGFLPMLMGTALGVLSTLWLVEIALTVRRRAAEPAGDVSAALRPVLLTGLFVAFILNMEFGGLPFYPSAALFIFLAACLIGERSPKVAAIALAVAVGGTLLAWALFTHVFLVIIR